MRYLAVGDARAHVLHAVPHVEAHARNIEKALQQLSPTLVLVDRSQQEWARLGRLGPLDQRMFDVMGGTGLAPDAVWLAVRDHIRRDPSCRLALLHGERPPVPTGKGGLKTLDKMLKKEGFAPGASPVQNLKRLYFHYMKRCPDLWEHIEQRRDDTAKSLRLGLSSNPQRPLVIVPSPDVDEVCRRARQ